jgi:alpha-tubulin suppressor-like RCC1 family protein
VQVDGLTNVTAVAAGFLHTCAQTSDGSVWCWGSNGLGQLGDGTTTERTTPVKVVGLTDATAITAGAAHSCALTKAGAVFCWGDNYFGELGLGADDAGPDAAAPGYVRLVPQKVPVPVAVGVTSGANAARTCARFGDSPVLRCWGDNRNRCTVPGSMADTLYLPTPFQPDTFAFDGGALVLGTTHTCAVADDRVAWCWGQNVLGQIGKALNGGAPSKQLDLGKVDEIRAGGSATCAIANGDVVCMGDNAYGELGQGTIDDPPPDGGSALAHPTPVVVGLPCP